MRAELETALTPLYRGYRYRSENDVDEVSSLSTLLYSVQYIPVNPSIVVRAGRVRRAYMYLVRAGPLHSHACTHYFTLLLKQPDLVRLQRHGKHARSGKSGPADIATTNILAEVCEVSPTGHEVEDHPLPSRIL